MGGRSYHLHVEKDLCIFTFGRGMWLIEDGEGNLCALAGDEVPWLQATPKESKFQLNLNSIVARQTPKRWFAGTKVELLSLLLSSSFLVAA